MEAYCPAGSGNSYFKERFYLYLDRDLCKLFFSYLKMKSCHLQQCGWTLRALC